MSKMRRWSDLALILAAYQLHEKEIERGEILDEHPEVRRGDNGALISCGGECVTNWMEVRYKSVRRLFTEKCNDTIEDDL